MMVARPQTLIDTNILLRYLITDFAEHAKVKLAVDNLIYQGHIFWISRQIIREFSTVCTRPQSFMRMMTSSQTTTYLLRFPTMFKIADEDKHTTQALIQLMQTIPIGGKQIHDANIVATMQVYGIPNLLTLNVDDFKRFKHLITMLPMV